VINGNGNDQGRLYLFGPVEDFTVGGQELWIDNICPESCCIDFESLALSKQYNAYDFAYDSGARIDVLPFTWSNGTVFSGGHATVVAGGLAGGTGKEMHVNNVNLSFDFGVPFKALTLLFGEYGGNMNIQINGDFRNFANLTDIDGITIGGVNVSITNGYGNDTGHLELAGTTHQFFIGGQELWIDNVCVDRLETVYLPLVLKP
jgi:hypothetical protein